MNNKKKWNSIKRSYRVNKRTEKLTVRQALQKAFSFVDNDDAVNDLKWLLQEQLGYDNMQLLVHYGSLLSEQEISHYCMHVKQYLEGVPAQYIIGHSWFYGHRFKVNPSVLIPRPETEELVQFYLNHTDAKPKKVLDIGTGSGAIAISIKLARPQDEVWAVDISQSALTTAQENAVTLGADVHFAQSNLFSALNGETFDIILSNPPYISAEEWRSVDSRVKDYEPELALLAEQNGLAIYDKISANLAGFLRDKSWCLFEIGFQQGESVQAIFRQVFPTAKIKCLQDMSGHDRLLWLRP